MKMFKLDEEYSIVCEAENTRYGFRHIAHLLLNGHEIDKTKICYYNRTWEAYEFQSVIYLLLKRHFDSNDIHTTEYEKYIEILENQYGK